ncbi:MAG: hypothetical protein ACJ75J_13430 [Cytophagaceae bacterium]
MSKHLYIFLLAVSLFSCKRKEEVFDLGEDYFPVRNPNGNYIIYDVQRIIFQATGPDTSNYQLKEVVGDTVTLNGKLYYKVWRYSRPDASGTWPAQPDSVWYEYNNGAQAVKDENNRNYIKLIFPVEENKTWNGNALNIYASDDYTMVNVGKSYTSNGHYFPTTVKVVQNDEASLVDEDKRYEVYAKGIGLIEKYVDDVIFCSDPTCIQNKTSFGIDSIIGGIRYKQVFNSYQ